MRAREFLIEYRRDVTAQKSGERLLARNKSADLTKINDVDKLLAALETADPTPNKQYMLWIVNRYIAGDFFLEDLEIVKRYLEKFIEARQKRLIDVVDINRYTLGALKEKINKIYQSDSNDTSGMGGASYPVIPGTQVLYNGPQGQFAVMTTLEGSMKHNKQVGKAAEWCTADSRAPKHFPTHAKQGPLYVYVDPQGEKYQLHFETNQFKDVDDNEIKLELARQIVSLPFVWKNIDWSRAIKTGSEKAIQLIPLDLFRTPDMQKMLLVAVRRNETALGQVPEEFRTPELCLAAVQGNGLALRYVPKKFRTPELCLAAVQQNEWALQYVPEESRTSEMYLSAVQQDGEALGQVPEKLRTPKLCLMAVQENGRALYFVPEELRTPDLCLAAIQQNGWALKYLSEKSRTPDLCLAAVQQSGTALQFVPDELRTLDLCLAAVRQSGWALEHVPDKLRTFEICLAAVRNDKQTLHLVPNHLQQEIQSKLRIPQRKR